MIKCEKVRFHLATFSVGEVGRSEAEKIEEHLAGCANCRENLQVIQKLHALLVLKRYEKPDELFLRTYLTEFHRRLLSEIVRKVPFWERVLKAFSWSERWGEIPLRFRWGAAVGIVLIGFCTVYVSVKKETPYPFRHHRAQGFAFQSSWAEATTSPEVSSTEVASNFNHLILADNPPDKNLVYVMDRVHYEPFTHGSIVLEF